MQYSYSLIWKEPQAKIVNEYKYNVVNKSIFTLCFDSERIIGKGTTIYDTFTYFNRIIHISH